MLKSGSPSNPNLLVAVRIRPESQRELADPNSSNIIHIIDGNCLSFEPTERTEIRKGKPGTTHNTRTKAQRFTFDAVLGPETPQNVVYESTTQWLIEHITNGYNGSVFAYGATGAGKTHTMIGNEQEPGVMVQTLHELYRHIEQRSEEEKIDVGLSYLEVYNEQIRDLLVEEPKPLTLRENGQGAASVAGLSVHRPNSAAEVFNLLAQGNTKRSQSFTHANSESSRSHAVLQIHISASPRHHGASHTVKTGKLCLIDLAGSERAAKTLNAGARLLEGANINKSLLALGNCINALGEKGGRLAHIPFRDSKLTRLLKDSLGGDCRTVMIANVSPSSLSSEDTFNTLLYANRAKNIKNKVVQHTESVDSHVSEYRSIIRDLQTQVQTLQAAQEQAGHLAVGRALSTLLDTFRKIDAVYDGRAEAAVGLQRVEKELDSVGGGRDGPGAKANLLREEEGRHTRTLARTRVQLDEIRSGAAADPNNKIAGNVWAELVEQHLQACERREFQEKELEGLSERVAELRTRQLEPQMNPVTPYKLSKKPRFSRSATTAASPRPPVSPAPSPARRAALTKAQSSPSLREPLSPAPATARSPARPQSSPASKSAAASPRSPAPRALTPTRIPSPSPSLRGLPVNSQPAGKRSSPKSKHKPFNPSTGSQNSPSTRAARPLAPRSQNSPDSRIPKPNIAKGHKPRNSSNTQANRLTQTERGPARPVPLFPARPAALPSANRLNFSQSQPRVK